jgi:hypothetical protein
VISFTRHYPELLPHLRRAVLRLTTTPLTLLAYAAQCAKECSVSTEQAIPTLVTNPHAQMEREFKAE